MPSSTPNRPALTHCAALHSARPLRPQNLRESPYARSALASSQRGPDGDHRPARLSRPAGRCRGAAHDEHRGHRAEPRHPVGRGLHARRRDVRDRASRARPRLLGRVRGRHAGPDHHHRRDSRRRRGRPHGIAVDVDYASNRFIYLCASRQVAAGWRNQVLYGSPTTAAFQNGTVLEGNMPANTIHNGCALEMDSFGVLWVSMGDSSNAALAQNRNSLNGRSFDEPGLRRPVRQLDIAGTRGTRSICWAIATRRASHSG